MAVVGIKESKPSFLGVSSNTEPKASCPIAVHLLSDDSASSIFPIGEFCMKMVRKKPEADFERCVFTSGKCSYERNKEFLFN